MSLHFVTLGVSTRCPACRSQMPIDGPLREVRCRRCAHVEAIDGPTWAYVLRCAYEGIVRTTFAQSFTFTYPVGGLPCPACSSKIDLGELPTAFDGGIECPHCATPFEMYPPPDWLAVSLPQLLQIYAAAREPDPATEPVVDPPRDTDIVPVALTCPNCDGVFTVPPRSERAVTCDQCQAELLIPDEEWMRIRPLGKIRLWAFCYDADMGSKTGDEELTSPHVHGSVSSSQPPPDTREPEVAGLFGDGFEGDVDALLATPGEVRRPDSAPLVTKTSDPPPPFIQPVAPDESAPPLPRPLAWLWIGLGLLAGALAAAGVWWFRFHS